MEKLLFIAAGGGVGSVMRYLVAGFGQRLIVGPFPLGTLIVNVIGCFALGLLGAAFAGPVLIREEYKLAILVGLLGGFTTFSTYGWETLSLVNDGQTARALANIVLSNVLGLAAALAGYRIAQQWLGV